MCTSQVATDLAAALKELVENALDAGGTVIQVTLEDHGIASIRVSDNGLGIPTMHLNSLCLPHYTSKISEFSDIASVTSYGFRGEALSALTALSDLSVMTQHGGDHGTHTWFDRNGGIARQMNIPRATGSTIIASNLFSVIPVRRELLKKNAKREFSKCVDVIMSYALLLNVSFTLTHVNAKKYIRNSSG